MQNFLLAPGSLITSVSECSPELFRRRRSDPRWRPRNETACGSAIFQHTWALEQIWVFIVFPVLGAAVAFVVWQIVGREESVVAAPGIPPDTETPPR